MTRTATLRDLALARRLPDHQMMDRETLGWIEMNAPRTPTLPASCHPQQLPLLIPDTDWFTAPALADGAHGVRHNARVSLLAAVLAAEHRLGPEDTDALRVAGAVHDCRRADDRHDPGHGRRAADWLLQATAAVTEGLGVALPETAVRRAAVAIALHDVPYGDFTPAQARAYRHAAVVVDLLKAADCLDRYRLPLRRWWPDTSHLRATVRPWCHGLAAQLVIRSETARLDGATHAAALHHATNPR
ncbi:hypothetical protein SAMN05216251_14316 [Actinacidiphila alni]|uniref:HD domain-containing protein n=1 Tax=Actinacidiphila alni TaxID=380248 RepID=A0A1I2N0D4_9ACTN|nr:hypothetical protein [Actinacidiphila alni]SFF94831.1 hypothetical protein SAMN05216251_14316 [Actinacidiphila alni]